MSTGPRPPESQTDDPEHRSAEAATDAWIGVVVSDSRQPAGVASEVDPSHLAYLRSLETRLLEQTDDLENRHMEASIDARIGLDDDVASENDSPPVDPEVIAARNVHSPFMPATSD